MADATEYAMPNLDIDLGVHQPAAYNYYPGWRQLRSIGGPLMNEAAFEAAWNEVPGGAVGDRPDGQEGCRQLSRVP